jgi:hypothetical protein
MILLAGITNPKSYSKTKGANKFASSSSYDICTRVIRSRSGWRYGQSYFSHSKYAQGRRYA